jgi:hypothetical protein
MLMQREGRGSHPNQYGPPMPLPTANEKNKILVYISTQTARPAVRLPLMLLECRVVQVVRVESTVRHPTASTTAPFELKTTRHAPYFKVEQYTGGARMNRNTAIGLVVAAVIIILAVMLLKPGTNDTTTETATPPATTTEPSTTPSTTTQPSTTQPSTTQPSTTAPAQ